MYGGRFISRGFAPILFMQLSLILRYTVAGVEGLSSCRRPLTAFSGAFSRQASSTLWPFLSQVHQFPEPLYLAKEMIFLLLRGLEREPFRDSHARLGGL